ncbi:MAG: 1,4-alpha-glucan branching protein GlgB [Pseudomonadota bacterium]
MQDETAPSAYPVGDASDFAALVDGRHGDPFAILGPHKRGRATWLTVFDPGAEEMAARIGERRHALEPLFAYPGLFQGKIPGTRPYLLEGTRADGEGWRYEDPYRFGPVLGELDEYLAAEGSHERLWRVLGAHVMEHQGVLGTHFAVWAPNARAVSVVGSFNFWDRRRHAMRRRGTSGIWEVFLPEITEGEAYKFAIVGPDGADLPLKADPLGFGSEHAPSNASVVRDISGYGWSDTGWMQERRLRNGRYAPISIYEVHLGSWRRKEGGRQISYAEAAEELVDYVAGLGFTHIELMPISEYPFDGSWGYQPVGLYAPTIRHGPPHEFRDMVNAAHRAGLGVILDWVPGHFPTDDHGLGRFDGTPLYEHADPREGFHQDWNTLIFNYGRREVRNYLVSNALYWLEEYHADGLRVDAVASMLYRDYSRDEGEWVPNKDGGRENYEAIAMLQAMNTETYGKVPGILTAAEESTSYPQVSAPVDAGGLGFGYKWNMGWMNDTLDYISREPIHRKFHHDQVTFGLSYAFSENFILPLSHDEVVHGKGSILGRMPGDEWQQFANMRAYYGFMWGHPGKKLLFMGQEFAQGAEWNHDTELAWHEADRPLNQGVSILVGDLNRLYRAEPALHVKDCEAEGFEWLVMEDAEASIFAWARHGGRGDRKVAVLSNFTPTPREGYLVGLPMAGTWREALNTDAARYGGSNMGNNGAVEAVAEPHHGKPASARVTLPPLATVFLIHQG